MRDRIVLFSEALTVVKSEDQNAAFLEKNTSIGLAADSEKTVFLREDKDAIRQYFQGKSGIIGFNV